MSIQTIDLDALTLRLLSLPTNDRIMVALVGQPGSGKSTLAFKLLKQLNEARPGGAALLPMDGYHYDDGLLTELGRLAHKGAPDTFDVDGLRHMLLRLRENTEEQVAIPVFDRAVEISRASARLIPRHVGIIIVEGNYLLLRKEPWVGLQPLFDLSVFIETPEEELRKRLTHRWVSLGLSEVEVRRKVEKNDLPNARFVIAKSDPADFRLEN